MSRIVRFPAALLLVVSLLRAGGAAPPARTEPAADLAGLTYAPDNPALLTNPLKGLLPWARRADSFPHSMEWFYMRLGDVMTSETDFDWRPLETRLNDIASRGDQAIFRFYVDYPNQPTAIPDYLLKAGLKTFPYTDSNNTRSVAPDYSDPRLMRAFTSFVSALGAKYDNDPRIAFIQAGLYGFWGEWHVHNHPAAGEPEGWRISQKDKDALLAAYLKAFPHTLIQIRYATCTTDPRLQRAFGYHDDSIGRDTVGEKDWFFWKKMSDAGLEQIWRTRPIGGEMYPALSKTLWDRYPQSDDQNVEEDIRTTHMTWMSNNNAFGTLTPEQRSRALAAHRLMGYELFVSGVRVDRAGADRAVEIAIENRGIAPFYYNWKVELAACSGTGGILATYPTDWRLTDILPGTPVRWRTSLKGVPAGTAFLLLRVVNPLANGKAVAFANKEWNQTARDWLTLGPNP